MQQFVPGSFFINRLVLVATSKTSSTPSPVNALHSMYFLAPMALATCFASSAGTISSTAFSLKWASCLKSFFRPTRTIGASGQYRNASSAHFVLALLGIQSYPRQTQSILCLPSSMKTDEDVHILLAPPYPKELGTLLFRLLCSR